MRNSCFSYAFFPYIFWLSYIYFLFFKKCRLFLSSGDYQNGHKGASECLCCVGGLVRAPHAPSFPCGSALGACRVGVLFLMRSVATLFVLLSILAWVLHLCHYQSAHLYSDLLSKLIPVRGNKVEQDSAR